MKILISDNETAHDDTLSESENDNLIHFHSLSISKALNKKSIRVTPIYKNIT